MSLLDLSIEVAVSLFSVVNPFGAVPMYLGMTQSYTRAERAKTARNTSIYFTLILLTFFLAGSQILSFFGLQVSALRIAGGIVILNSSFALLNDRFAQSRAINDDVTQEALTKPDISFSPLAMPMLSGPGSISMLISLYAAYTTFEQRVSIAAVILLNGIVVFFVLNAAPFLHRVLGVSGLKAGSRIMGFIVMAIGVQYIIKGIVTLVQDYAG